MRKLSWGLEIQCDAWQVETMPWTAKQHLWKSKAKEGQQLSRGGPSNRQKKMIWASACDFQQFHILTSVDSDEPVQPPFKLRNSKWRSVSSLTIIEYSSDKHRLWSGCAYAQAGLRLCWSHIPNCWKSHALAHIKNCVTRYVVPCSVSFKIKWQAKTTGPKYC